MKRKDKPFTLRNHIEIDCAIAEANKREQDRINLSQILKTGIDQPHQDYYGGKD